MLDRIYPTCTGTTPNNNGALSLTAITNATKYGISNGATYTGPTTFAAATAINIGALPLNMQSSISNAGVIYTLRFFNGADDCYKDTTINFQTTFCHPACSNIDGPTATTCDSVMLMATPCYVNGNPVAGGTSGTADAFVIFKSNYVGETTAPDNHLPASQMGSVWGVAYKNSNNNLYTSAFLKRHMGFGPEGPGAIYKLNPTDTMPTATLFVDLVDLGIAVGTDPRTPTSGSVDNANELPAATSGPSWDSNAFDLVGKMSLGGLDIAADGAKMYVMNLHTKSLVALNISGATPALIGSYPIPNPNCSNGDYRPWAVKSHNGKVYVGVVCTAETSQLISDLRATIFEFDGTSFCEVFGFDLDYPRGNAGGASGILTDPAEWLPWTNTIQSVSATLASHGTVIYPQPILSDIEFDMDGSMILAFMDRNGRQTGVQNYAPTYLATKLYTGQSAGDILRVGKVAGAYQLENNGQINGVQAASTPCWTGSITHGMNNQQGPGGGEYYWSDNFRFNGCNATAASDHEEIGFGGLAFVPGSGEVAMTGMDPTNTATSGGISWHNNTTGKRRIDETAPFDLVKHGYRIYDSAAAGNFGKAAGLGDLEVFCTACTPPVVADVAPTCPSGGGPVASTFDFGQSGNWTILSQPAGTTASITSEGIASGLTLTGDYIFQLEIGGCTDQATITIPTCCQARTCLPIIISKM